MKISLDALQIIDAIETRGSYAAAGQALHRVPSALTHAVKKLEGDLGFPLFVLEGRRAVLTPAGRSLLDDGRTLLRAADELECRARRVATGWETELRIAVDGLIPSETLFPLLNDFYSTPDEKSRGTEIRISTEVLGGCWDALITGRADLSIGASGDMPAGGGFSTVPIRSVDFVFAIAPQHPLASQSTPVTAAQIREYRAIAIADTSRQLTARSSGLLTGQEVLTVPDMQSKIAAQAAGLGVGYLSRERAEREVAAGRLVICETAEARQSATLYLAWRTNQKGKALQWFVSRLRPAATGD